jgi:hypothetical protein
MPTSSATALVRNKQKIRERRLASIKDFPPEYIGEQSKVISESNVSDGK